MQGIAASKQRENCEHPAQAGQFGGMADRCVHASRGHDRSGGTFLRVPHPQRERRLAGGFSEQHGLPDLSDGVLRNDRQVVSRVFPQLAPQRAGKNARDVAQAVSRVFLVVRSSPSGRLVCSFRP